MLKKLRLGDFYDYFFSKPPKFRNEKGVLFLTKPVGVIAGGSEIACQYEYA